MTKFAKTCSFLLIGVAILQATAMAEPERVVKMLKGVGPAVPGSYPATYETTVSHTETIHHQGERIPDSLLQLHTFLVYTKDDIDKERARILTLENTVRVLLANIKTLSMANDALTKRLEDLERTQTRSAH
jgi:hypothetical protein